MKTIQYPEIFQPLQILGTCEVLDSSLSPIPRDEAGDFGCPGIKARCLIFHCQVNLDAVPRDLNDLEARLSLRCRVASEWPAVSDEIPTFHSQKDTSKIERLL